MKKKCSYCGKHLKRVKGFKHGDYCSEEHAALHGAEIAKDWMLRKGNYEEHCTTRKR